MRGLDSIEIDRYWMRRALAEAARGRGFVEPNPMVGAVLVQGDRLIGFGHHERYGGPHAEIMALRMAGDQARGSTLYVTLEPCSHYGKTPPCADALIEAGVREVVAAMGDPFPRVDGQGLHRLAAAGVTVRKGIETEACVRLNAPYLKRLSTGLPFVMAKWAMTLDGKMACASGDSRWISNERSRAVVHEIRGQVDAILVGIGTALADDPALTARPPGPRQALRVVLDAAAQLPVSSRLACTASEIPMLVMVNEDAFPERVDALDQCGCQVIRFPGRGRLPVIPILEELGRRDVTNVLLEGGPKVMGAFLDAGQIDAVHVFVAPRLEGGAHAFVPMAGQGLARMADAMALAHVEIRDLDGDLNLAGHLPQAWFHRMLEQSMA